MKISIINTSHPGFIASKEEFDIFSGKTAGVCYMPNSFEELVNEDLNKTQRRINQTKMSGHHSVYDHNSISLYLEDIPKALAMVLNNEKQYTTSEKSARYTKMILKEDEQKLYDKWIEIFRNKITEKYKKQYPDFFSDSKIEKLAQENARYLISVFTPTSMVYSTTYRQLNYLYNFMQKEINRKEQNKFYERLIPSMVDFCHILEQYVPYLDSELSKDNKGRALSLYNANKPKTYFGDVYATSYKGSFAQLAQAHRHRTLSYTICLLDEIEFYIPPIIKKNKALVKVWIEDCTKQASNFPQGMLININEMGTMDNFVLKMMERKCTFAQLEINDQTNATLKKFSSYLKKHNHQRAEELESYMKGSRCTFANFKCTAPCGFKEGIIEKRII